MDDSPRRSAPRWLAMVLAACMMLTACSAARELIAEDATPADGGLADPGDCIVVDMAVSSEKIDLLTDLAREFNGSDEAQVDGTCVFVRPASKASGAAMQLLADGWPDQQAEGPRPVIWSPASSAWGSILNQLRTDAGEPQMVGEGRPFMLTPLVIAMPEPMAAALGYPETPIGWADILELARSDEGWGAYDHPEWGPFRLGKTNPNYSTSGLSALIAQTYAATGSADELTTEALAQPEVEQFARDIESAVVHYGDTTLTFLNNFARNDARGTALTYASAVAVEEVSLINYNRGNPDGVLEPGEELIEPKIPLVAIYPEEGTLFSDNPFFVVDAEWVSDDQRTAAGLFEEFVQRPENQRRVLEFGFRPGNPEVAVEAPITPALGVDPDQPETTLDVPEPAVLVEMLRRWDTQRKSARVLLVLDVSGSMGDPAGAGDATKLELAVQAASDSLEQFQDRDEVGLRIFSTELEGPGSTTDALDLVEVAPIGGQRDELRSRLEGLTPVLGTPLYDVTAEAYEQMTAEYEGERINAIVLLTDGRNDDPDGQLDLSALLDRLAAGSEGRQSQPVRIFPIAYGSDADLATLQRLAEATNAAVYDASDPTSISKVFDAVISNF
ncbi:MAG TPA: substrate-binding domain-containing protein [Euzebyales bacterium]|nr:substrate-binding domain-containing protein [Euzebyales bacterium]